jgi:hypothetical protein
MHGWSGEIERQRDKSDDNKKARYFLEAGSLTG